MGTKMRFAVLAVMLLILGGCLLPPAYHIASWTFSGISYLFTGKSVSDHALSVAMKQDCATHRIVAGSRICLLHDGEPVDDLTAVALLGDELEGTAGYPVALDPVTLPAHMGDLVSILGTAAKPTTRPDALAVLPLLEPESPLAQTLNDIAPAAGVSDHAALWLNADEITSKVAPPERLLAANWAASSQSEIQNHDGGGLYVVIGSFLSLSNAEQFSLLHESFGMAVIQIERGGTTWYRVTAGPVAP
jgi:hypothetical protein